MSFKAGFVCALILSTVFSVGCKDKEEDLDVALADAVAMGVSSLSGLIDDQSGESLAKLKKPKKRFRLISKAYASVCSGRAVTEACQAGVKTKFYDQCEIGDTSQTLSGSVNLDYSDAANCDLDTDGEFVTRTYSYTRTTAWGATVETSSSEKTDFEGRTYGGGARLTKTALGHELVILGKHRIRTSARGRSRLNLSLQTESPLQITGGIARAGRTLTSGRLVLAHNISKYKVIMEPLNLGYSESCCYPTSGTLNLTYEGSLTGSGSVSFAACGEALVIRGNETYSISLDSCE